MKSLQRFILVACALACFYITASGCTKEKKSTNPTTAAKPRATAESRASHVADAINYLSLLMRLDRSVAVKEVNYQLNSWAQVYDAKDGWKRNELLNTLQGTAAQSPILQTIGRVHFEENECEYLLQCQMMKSVSDWVLRGKYLDPLFADWVVEKGKSLSDVDRRKLESTVKLFDWSIRNVALDGQAKDAERLEFQPKWPLDDQNHGYRQLPWQTMIYGRSDTWLRARVFTQLLQQADITAVVLAIPDEDTKELRLWCVGVPIADELYLFEPRWGLPIPGPNEQGIATLQQAKDDRNILRRANLPGQFEYPVKQTDLNNLIALIDLDPFAMSHSMFAVEPVLAGKNRMNVYVDPTPTIEAVSKVIEPAKIQLWEMPLMAIHYNNSVRARIFDQSPFSFNYLAIYGAFFTDTLMSTARKDHFEGQFESTPDRNGALKNYMSLRVDDATLSKLSYDKDVQRSLSVVRGKYEKLEAFVARTKQIEAYYRVAKFHTSTFLGLSQMELGNMDAAIDWLDTRTLRISDTQAWHPHAEYLLSRCFELKGDSTKAIDFLKRENRAQEAGNRIRARLIQAKTGKE